MRHRLKEERMKRSWTQRFVAEKIGITTRAYQYYERGKRDPLLDTANKLEDLFGINQRELLVRNDTPDSNTA